MISPKLPAPRQTALFLDVDGTLLELAPRSKAAGTLGAQLIERMRLPTQGCRRRA
jgi:trehalose-6-phosphatase